MLDRHQDADAYLMFEKKYLEIDDEEGNRPQYHRSKKNNKNKNKIYVGCMKC